MASDLTPPLVSIGVPVFNGERYLREALDSALAQDYADLEILISDNASTDATADIARQYARMDPRVRYWRNPGNLGLWGNFGRVLAEARGRYFTWLACDDVLSSPHYVSKSVAFLEANPGVVLCGCDLQMRYPEGPASVLRFPRMHADRDGRETRAFFFAWPPVASLAIYAMFRREALTGASFAGRTYLMEYPILLPVLKHGRFVALPEVLRTYRDWPESSWHREWERLSGLKLLLWELQTKWFLLKTAWRFPVPRAEKINVLGVTLRNFLAVRPLYSARGQIRQLRATAEERRQLILRLRAEIDKRRDLLRRHGWGGVDPVESWPADMAAGDEEKLRPAEGASPRGMRGRVESVRVAVATPLIDFFRPPSARQFKCRRDLGDSQVLHRLCEDRLQEIHRLTAEADRCLAIIHSSQASSRPAESEVRINPLSRAFSRVRHRGPKDLAATPD